MKARKVHHSNRKAAIEAKMSTALEDLSEFESFKRDLLPKIRQALKDGKKPEEIMNLAKSLAAARVATIAAFDLDSKTALTAARDLLDRTEGKAKETKEIRHAMANAKDEDIDAVLLTALSDDEDASGKD